MEQFKKRYR